MNTLILMRKYNDIYQQLKKVIVHLIKTGLTGATFQQSGKSFSRVKKKMIPAILQSLGK